MKYPSLCLILALAALLASCSVVGCNTNMSQQEKIELVQTIGAEAYRWFLAYRAGTTETEVDDHGLSDAQKTAFWSATAQGALVASTQPPGTPALAAAKLGLEKAQDVADARGKAYWAKQGLADPPGFDYLELAEQFVGGDFGEVEDADDIDVFMAIINAYQAQQPVDPAPAAPAAPAAP